MNFAAVQPAKRIGYAAFFRPLSRSRGREGVTAVSDTVMRLTTKGRFAVTAMLDVAMHAAPGPVTLAAIAERQGISLSYLEQLFGRLRRHGLVASVRGPGGGYRLARDGAAITVADVIVAVDGPADAAHRDDHAVGRDPLRSLTRRLWTGLDAHIFGYLRSVTLAELVARQGEPPATANHGAEELPLAAGTSAVRDARSAQGGDEPHSRAPAATV